MMDGVLAAAALGSFATQVRNSVLLAVDSVKETSLTLVETVKEKSATISLESISDSIVENATIVKTKSFEVAENVKEKSVEVADTMKKGAVAVAENVQGRLAPKTVKREGYLAKQVNGNKWTEYYFVLQDGCVQVLATQNAEKEEFSVELDCIKRADPVDVIVTGTPHCLRVTITLLDKPSTVVNNWAFFGVNFFVSHRVNNQELDIILKATDEEEMRGWVRELTSTSSGLAIQDQLKKTGEGAMRLAETTGLSSFMNSLKFSWS